MSNNINPIDFENLKKKYLQEMKKLIDTQIKKFNTKEFAPQVNTDTQESNSSESYKEFLQQNTGKGTLKVQVSAARESIPIPNANVIISKIIGNEEKIFYSEITDESGIVDNLILPAPNQSCENSFNMSNQASGTMYDITIMHSDFQQISEDQVEIFDGIKSTKTVEVIPTE